MSVISEHVTSGSIKSKKLKSLTVTENLEVQGIFHNNAINTVPLQTRVLANKNTTQSIPDAGAVTSITAWTSESDPSGSFNTTTGLWTCPLTGLWYVQLYIQMASATFTKNFAQLSGTAVTANTPVGSSYLTLIDRGGDAGPYFSSVSALWPIAKGQTIQCQCGQESGGAVNLDGAQFTATLIAKTLGA
jgi:hypothetical protein